MDDFLTALGSISPTAQPDFFTGVGSSWTDAQLRDFLDRAGLKYEPKQRSDVDNRVQYTIIGGCPLCGRTEGNPATWLKDGQPCFKCFGANHCDAPPKKTFTDLRNHFRRSDTKIVSIGDKSLARVRPREFLIQDFLYDDEVMTGVGGSKSRKSFAALQLAISVATGTNFLGMETTKSRVLVVDNELLVDLLQVRAKDMTKAMGLDWSELADNCDLLSLRGEDANLDDIINMLEPITPGTYGLIVLDALYKCYPKGIDENSNADMSRVYSCLTRMTRMFQSAVFPVHHTSKGSQHAKSTIDLGAGAGAIGRSGDVHFGMRDHENENTVVIETVFRHKVRLKPFCAIFDYPLWRLAPDANPERLSAEARKKPIVGLEEFLGTIPPTPSPKTQVLEESKEALGITVKAIKALLREAMSQNLVEITAPEDRTLPHLISRTKKKRKSK